MMSLNSLHPSLVSIEPQFSGDLVPDYERVNVCRVIVTLSMNFFFLCTSNSSNRFTEKCALRLCATGLVLLLELRQTGRF